MRQPNDRPGRPGRALVVIACLAAAGALAGCASSSGSSTASSSTGASSASSASSATGKNLTIGLVYGALTNPFFLKAEAGAKTEAAKLGVTIDVTGGQDYTQPEETTALNTLLAAHPAGLLIAPVDADGVVSALNPWVQAGIPMATYDSIARAGSVPLVTQVTTQNFQEGEAAAKLMATSIGGSGDVAIISLTTSSAVLTDRVDGFQAELKNYPNVHVVASEDTGSNDPSIPLAMSQTLINKYSDLKGIFTTYNIATESVAKGVDQLGKKGKVIVAGSDGDQALYSLVQNGSVQILFQQQAAQETAYSLQCLVTAIRGGAKTCPSESLPDVLVTPQNVGSMASYMY